ncbi:uncharacterized protein LOC103713546 isoform X3 [Phoenix dactylifera]|uniref:Uncharacterized protein LOC103713546 isoform X3 n=1 Tax=Phoenix dactylifera TaxID=42345 RepID=A0A8B8ZFA6_PHODC|nr:uncharacterized protein LOC103713546 isoform X3 [Phoenix dactylifera]
MGTTSSMVAAICYAWLLENREKEQGGSGVVAPVVSMKRGRMLKQKQAAWLFFHLGIDASALLFSDEVDLEGLMLARQLSILVIGQDVLKTNSEVGSLCTVLTDNYCEEAYDLLETPNLKKLLLAGILLDTQNLNSAAKFFTNKDAEAVQLLLVGSAPSQRHELFEQLMQDHRESTFLEALRQNYGKPFNEDNYGSGESREQRTSTTKSASISPQEVNIPTTAKQKPTPAPAPAPAPTLAPVKAQEIASRGKNKFFLAKWFGFGSK